MFTLGVLTAGVVAASDRIRRLPWHLLAAVAAAPVLLLMAVRGSGWAVRHYYWVDLAAGPGRPDALSSRWESSPRTAIFPANGPCRWVTALTSALCGPARNEKESVQVATHE